MDDLYTPSIFEDWKVDINQPTDDPLAPDCNILIIVDEKGKKQD